MVRSLAIRNVMDPSAQSDCGNSVPAYLGTPAHRFLLLRLGSVRSFGKRVLMPCRNRLESLLLSANRTVHWRRVMGHRLRKIIGLDTFPSDVEPRYACMAIEGWGKHRGRNRSQPLLLRFGRCTSTYLVFRCHLALALSTLWFVYTLELKLDDCHTA